MPLDPDPDKLPLGFPIIVQLPGVGRFTNETLPVFPGHKGWVTPPNSGGEITGATVKVIVAEVAVAHEEFDIRA